MFKDVTKVLYSFFRVNKILLSKTYLDPIINSVFKFIFAYRVSQQNLLQLSDSKVEHLSHDRRTNDFVKDHEEHLVESDER